MRKTLFTLCFVMIYAISAFSQSKSSKDAMRDSVLYVVDGVKQRGIQKLDSADVFEIGVYKDSDVPNKIYGDAARNGVIEITTKQFAIKIYQKKLSEVSRKYKKYINRDKKVDSNYVTTSTYYLNGICIGDGSNETATKLYKLKSGDIENLKIEVEDVCNYVLERDYKIIITTKN